jgi:metal-dependent amidase/aminoacylase/carboxypeptidase family protein
MDTKTAARECFEAVQDRLTELSHRIHSHPELGFEEGRASSWLCESLADAGFSVRKGICDLPTAFVARAGSGPLHVGICAEYDCLPGIGHACGHNIIAASAVGAALAAAQVADEVGLAISVIGTPAEEAGNASGKILLLERGAFDGIHAAMMVHPAPFDMLRAKIIAASMFEVHYTGKESHASAFPELGVNAADALNPSHDRHQFPARRQSSAGIYCPLRHRPRRQGPRRRRTGNGMDLHRYGNGPDYARPFDGSPLSGRLGKGPRVYANRPGGTLAIANLVRSQPLIPCRGIERRKL